MWSPHTSTFPPTSFLCTNALSQKAFFLTVCELPEIRTLKPQSQKDVFKGNTISSSQAEILMTRILSIKFKVHIRKSPFLEGTLRKIPEVHLIRLELAVKGFFVFCFFFFGEGNGNPLQYSCLENPMDRGAWWATVHGVAKSRT